MYPAAGMRRDPYVEAMASSGATHLVNGLQLASALRGKRVFFNGDSIVEQLLRAWSCDLRGMTGGRDTSARSVEEVKEWEEFMSLVKKRGGSDPTYIGGQALDQIMKDSGLREGWGGGGDGGGCSGSLSVFRMGDRKIKDWIERAAAFETLPELDVLIIHFGLHYHDEAAMKAEYEMLMPKLNEFAAQPGKAAMILEIGSQHFTGAPTGAYEDRNPLTKSCYCAPHAEKNAGGAGELDRNKVIASFLEKYQNVKLIPFQELTKPRFAMHMKNRRLGGQGCDCTHWCHSTPFWRAVMGGITDAIKGKEGFPSFPE